MTIRLRVPTPQVTLHEPHAWTVHGIAAAEHAARVHGEDDVGAGPLHLLDAATAPNPSTHWYALLLVPVPHVTEQAAVEPVD